MAHIMAHTLTCSVVVSRQSSFVCLSEPRKIYQTNITISAKHYISRMQVVVVSFQYHRYIPVLELLDFFYTFIFTIAIITGM